MSRHPSRLIAWLLVVVALVSGCGTIKVTVDVLDPEHVRGRMEDVAERKQYREIQRAAPGDLAKQVDKQFDEFARQVQTIATAIRRTSDALPAEQKTPIERSAAMLEQGIGPMGSYRIDAAMTALKLEDLAQAIRENAALLKYTGEGPLPEELRGLQLDFQAKEKALRVGQVRDVRWIQQDLRERAAAAKARAHTESSPAKGAEAAATAAVAEKTASAIARTASAIAPAVANAVSAASRSIIGDGSLAATEFAYVVANAPPEMWELEFNRAFADTRFGSADMVIKLNSTADFSVKGLSFDASKVALVASKVLTQTVLVGAQVAGAPVTTASSGTTSGGDALSKSSSDLAAAEVVLATREASTAAQKSAIRSLARSLLAATSQLAGAPLATRNEKDTERTTLHDSIDSSFGALKSLLSLEDLE